MRPTTTSREEHQRNNDRVLLVYYEEMPETFARLVESSDADARAQLAARLANAGADPATIAAACLGNAGKPSSEPIYCAVCNRPVPCGCPADIGR